MLENEGKEIPKEKDTLRVAKFSRRQFLQRAGMAAGGAAITSISPVVYDSYNSGWMIALQLSTPDELKTLLTAQQYSDLAAKK